MYKIRTMHDVVSRWLCSTAWSSNALNDVLEGVAANVSLMWSLTCWLYPLATNLAFKGSDDPTSLDNPTLSFSCQRAGVHLTIDVLLHKTVKLWCDGSLDVIRGLLAEVVLIEVLKFNCLLGEVVILSCRCWWLPVINANSQQRRHCWRCWRYWDCLYLRRWSLK